MNRTICSLLGACALSMAFLAGPVAAEQPFYASFSLGQATDDELDESDIAWRIAGGYNFTDTWGVEVAYTSFGEPESLGVTLDYGGFGVYGTGRWAINEKFDVFGRAGVFFWDVEASFMGFTASDDGNDLAAGVGASWKFMERFRAEAVYERYLGISDSDVGMFSVGVAYQF